jgi:hypothetical protein
MSSFRFSTFVFELLGFNKQEADIIIKRDNEYNNKGIILNEKKVFSDLRCGGMSTTDRANSEGFNKEFGHLTNADPNKALKKFYR